MNCIVDKLCSYIILSTMHMLLPLPIQYVLCNIVCPVVHDVIVCPAVHDVIVCPAVHNVMICYTLEHSVILGIV